MRNAGWTISFAQLFILYPSTQADLSSRAKAFLQEEILHSQFNCAPWWPPSIVPRESHQKISSQAHLCVSSREIIWLCMTCLNFFALANFPIRYFWWAPPAIIPKQARCFQTHFVSPVSPHSLFLYVATKFPLCHYVRAFWKLIWIKIWSPAGQRNIRTRCTTAMRLALFSIWPYKFWATIELTFMNRIITHIWTSYKTPAPLLAPLSRYSQCAYIYGYPRSRYPIPLKKNTLERAIFLRLTALPPVFSSLYPNGVKHINRLNKVAYAPVLQLNN